MSAVAAFDAFTEASFMPSKSCLQRQACVWMICNKQAFLYRSIAISTQTLPDACDTMQYMIYNSANYLKLCDAFATSTMRTVSWLPWHALGMLWPLLLI